MLIKHLQELRLGSSWPKVDVATGFTQKCQDGQLVKILSLEYYSLLALEGAPQITQKTVPLPLIFSISKEIKPRSVARSHVPSLFTAETGGGIQSIHLHTNAHFQETQKSLKAVFYQSSGQGRCQIVITKVVTSIHFLSLWGLSGPLSQSAENLSPRNLNESQVSP